MFNFKQCASLNRFWAIVGDVGDQRNRVISGGIIDPLMKLVTPVTPLLCLRLLTWTISNLCCKKCPAPPFSAMRQLLALLVTLIRHSDNIVSAVCCWALLYLTAVPIDQRLAVINSGF